MPDAAVALQHSKVVLSLGSGTVWKWSNNQIESQDCASARLATSVIASHCSTGSAICARSIFQPCGTKIPKRVVMRSSFPAAPVSVHSISCNASNQDVVSMGTVAARKAFKAVSNAKHILTLEVLADLQALSFRNAGRLGRGTGRIYALLSQDFSVYDNREVFHEILVSFRRLLFSSQLFDDLAAYGRED